MRARYSAFALGDEAYLTASWAPATRPDRVQLVPDQRWVGLEVLASSGGGAFDADGTVEFRASFERGGRAGVLHERSAFVRDDGRWVYLGPTD